MQSKIGIAKLIMAYEFSVCAKTTIPMKFIPSQPFLTPADGMWLNLKAL